MAIFAGGGVMKDEYSVAQARDRLAALIKEAEMGKTITITRRGRPVAVLVSQAEWQQSSSSPFGDAVKRFMATLPEDWEGVETDYWDDLRDRDTGRPVEFD